MEASEMSEQEGTNTVSVPLYKKVAFGAGVVLPSMALAMWYAYAVAFLEKVLGLPARSTGTVVLIAQVAGAISAPMIGVWSDQSNCKCGRRRIVHLLSAVAIVSSFFFLWHECITCEHSPSVYQTIYFSSFAALNISGAVGCIISLYALIPEVATDTADNVALNSFYSAFFCLGHLMAYGGLWTTLTVMQSGSGEAEELSFQDKGAFLVTALIAIGAGTIFAVCFYIWAPESSNAELPKLKWYKWFLNIPFYLIEVILCQAQVTYTIPKTYLPLYLLYSLQMNKMSIAVAPTVFYISIICASIVVKPLSKLTGRKPLYCLGLLLACGSLIWLWFSEPTDDSTSIFNWKRDSIYGAVVILGIGTGISWVVSGSMGVDVIGEYRGSSAFFFGLQSLVLNAVCGVLVKVLQEAQPTTDTELPRFYRQSVVFPVLAASCMGLLSTVLLACYEKWTKVNEESQQRNQEVKNGKNSILLQAKRNGMVKGNVRAEENEHLLSSSDDMEDPEEQENHRANESAH